jgi:hypothetical protein
VTAPDRFDQCDECGHYREEHTPPEMTCACDVLAFGEWHVCPCAEFEESSLSVTDPTST